MYENINRVIVSDISGAGALALNKVLAKPEDLSGHTFYVDNHELIIGAGNVVTIPRELMEEIGYEREDGFYALPIYINFRHVNGKKVVGGGIIKGPKLGKHLENIKDGKTLPREAVIEDYENLEVLVPADIPEWTQSGEDA